jgi:hypothetical protein
MVYTLIYPAHHILYFIYPGIPTHFWRTVVYALVYTNKDTMIYALIYTSNYIMIYIHRYISMHMP